jgi:hypothetical protein
VGRETAPAAADCIIVGKEEKRGLGASTVLTIEFDGEVGVEVGVVGGDGWMGVERIGEVGLGVLELVLTAPPPLRCRPDRRLRRALKKPVAPVVGEPIGLTCSPT